MFYAIVGKCYCANLNGEGEKNAFRCQKDDHFFHGGYCSPREWCIGPTNTSAALNGSVDLCAEGIGIFLIATKLNLIIQICTNG